MGDRGDSRAAWAAHFCEHLFEAVLSDDGDVVFAAEFANGCNGSHGARIVCSGNENVLVLGMALEKFEDELVALLAQAAAIHADEELDGDLRQTPPYAFKGAGNAAEHQRAGTEVTVWTVGKKAQSYFRYRGIDVARSYPGVADRPEFADARSVAATVSAGFVAGEMDMVQLVSTRFISAGTQRVETVQMLPLPLPEVDENEPAADAALVGYTEFEPEPEKLLAELAPRAVEAEIFSALLEGSAAFFTAQQRAMAAATDNADELVRTLTRVMNRARQDAITTEIMEIVGGAEALRQSKGA